MQDNTPTRDREVYSRQELVIGEHGLRLLLRSALCVVGVDGIGVEVAKNSLLAGVSKLLLCDEKLVSKLDISTNFCLRYKPLTEFHGTRAEESVSILQRFNPTAAISTHTKLTAEFLEKFTPDVVVVCNMGWSAMQLIAALCRSKSIPVIAAFTAGLYYLYALDLGDDFKYLDARDYKQTDIAILDVTEIGNSPTKQFKLSISMEMCPLEDEDMVDFMDQSGKKLGIGNVETIDVENSTVTVSTEVAVQRDMFIIYHPTEASVSFRPLSELPVGTTKSTANKLAMGLKAWDRFRLLNSNPLPRDPTAFEAFLACVDNAGSEENKGFFKQFYDMSFSPSVPLNSIAGGLVSEEVVKILSRTYPPAASINGLHFFNSFYKELSMEDCEPENNEMGLLCGSQIINFGKRFQQKLAAKSTLMVGAGALGNEFLKGAAMIGMSTAENASFVVVDNDLVMTSNISRQLCFSEEDTNKPKAVTLCNKVKDVFNSTIRLEPLLLKLTHNTEDSIGHSRLNKTDLFVTALDNVAARNTVERISHMYMRPMIDGGTEGLEGNQENFFPLKTVEYYNPHVSVEKVVSCTPKPIVTNKSDVIHNAKIHFENVLNKIKQCQAENTPHVLYVGFLHDIPTFLFHKSRFFRLFSIKIETVWIDAPPSFKNPDGTLQGRKQPVLHNSIEEYQQFEQSVKDLESLQNSGKLDLFFDKDEPVHVRLLACMCRIVANTYFVPSPEVMEIRKKAGSIIPSIISTTALVAGFMLLNSLQIVYDAQKFVNMNYGQSCITLMPPNAYSTAGQSIYHFGKIRYETKFADVVNAVPAPYPEIEQCLLYGDGNVTITGRGLAKHAKASFLKFIMRNTAIGTRKHFVAEFIFRKVERTTAGLMLLRKTKYLILTLPSADVLRVLKDLMLAETEISALKQAITQH